MHPDPICDPDRADADQTGNVHRSTARARPVWFVSVGIHSRASVSDAGYSTALFGKWHCGAAPGRLPTDVGFDEWWGLKNSSDEAGYTAYPLFKESGVEPPMIWEGKKGQQSTPVMPLDMNVRPILDEKYIIPKTVNYIKAQAEAKKPFFVYVGYSEMHPPMVANPNFAGKSTARGGLYADVIAELDYRVGQVLDAIKDAGIDDNTILVLTSDNATRGGGASPGGSNGPWRGDFTTPPFEGSYRTFGMVRWPGHVPAGVVTNEMLSAEDWFATLASIADAANLIPKDRPIDSIDASRFLLGQSDTTGRDTFMLFGPDAELMSIKWKYFKVILRYAEGIDKPIMQALFPMVFDLSSDPQETNNLMASRLDVGWVFAPMFRKIGEYQASVQKYRNIRPGEDFRGYSNTPPK